MKTVLNWRLAKPFLMTEVTILPSRHKHAEPHTNWTFFQLILMHLLKKTSAKEYTLTFITCISHVFKQYKRRVKTGRDHDFLNFPSTYQRSF